MKFLSRRLQPKAELHCHFEGAAPPSLVARLARERGIAIDGLIDDQGGYAWQDFTSFLKAYDQVAALLTRPEDLSNLAYEYASSIAKEGAVYLEVFGSLAHAESCGLDYEDYVGGIADGFTRAEAEHGIVSRIVMTAVRHLGPEKALHVAKATIKADHPMVTGFGMGGDERMGDLADFAPAFDVARDGGLGITVHAGEFAGPESVRSALDHIRPSRIGHGVRAIEDPDLVKRLAEEKIVLEVCPASNVSLGLYPTRAAHPLRKLVEAGVRVTLNSDDPPFFHTTLGAEYKAAKKIDGFSSKELVGFTQTAIEAAFLEAPTRIRLVAMAANKKVKSALPTPELPRNH